VTISDIDKTLSRVVTTAKAREQAAREVARADRAVHAALVAARMQGASLRAIRDAAGGTISHERIRRIVAAAQKGRS
jgi:hypothetical protein